MFEIAGYPPFKILAFVWLLYSLFALSIPYLSKLKTRLFSPSVSPTNAKEEKTYAEKVAEATNNRNDIAVFAMVNNLTVPQVENLVEFIESLELKG